MHKGIPTGAKHCRRSLVALAAMLFVAAGQTADEAPAVVWWCHYDGNVSIFCEFVQGPAPKPVAEKRPLSRPSPYPSRGPLPPIVRVITQDPGALLGTTIRIPLFSPPLDMERVEQLADSVMCAGNPACRVEF